MTQFQKKVNKFSLQIFEMNIFQKIFLGSPVNKKKMFVSKILKIKDHSYVKELFALLKRFKI